MPQKQSKQHDIMDFTKNMWWKNFNVNFKKTSDTYSAPESAGDSNYIKNKISKNPEILVTLWLKQAW